MLFVFMVGLVVGFCVVVLLLVVGCCGWLCL